MPTKPNGRPDQPTQDIRRQFAAAIQRNDVTTVQHMLAEERALANADLRSAERRDHFRRAGGVSPLICSSRSA